MKTHRHPFILIALLMVAIPTISHATEILYTGSCHNVTFGADGQLKLYIVETDKGLKGYMSISGILVGSGPISGARTGNQFKFHTNDPVWGLDIEWQGALQGTKLSGEYYSAPNPTLGTGKQVGEWTTELATKVVDGKTSDEESFRQLFMLRSEIDLNNPVRLPNGTTVTGAQALFQAVHPAGAGISVNVTDARIEWKDGSAHTDAADIHRYTVDYVLYWQGVVRPTGWTRMRLAYNATLHAVTANEVIESTGITNKDAGDIAYGIGFLLGKAAMESLMNSR